MPLPGFHNVYNACCAAAICFHLGLNPEMIKAGLENAELQNNRMKIIRHNNMIIINDCYNANPLSMKRAIDTLKTVANLNDTRSVAILADMHELGADSASLHFETGRYLSENKIDTLIAYGPLSENICRGFSECGEHSKKLPVESETSCKNKFYYFKDKKQLCESLNGILKKDDTMLFKGSRANKLEDIIDYLLKA